MRTAQAVQHALDDRLVALGRAGFARQPHAFLVQAEDFDREHQGEHLRPPGLSVYVHRLEVNRATRAAWSAVAAVDGRPRLPVDLHFLLTAWADNADQELLLLGRAMLLFEESPTLVGPALGADHGFAPTEGIQILQDEVAADTLMRTFEALSATYHLSVPYIARIVRVESDELRPATDVGTVVAGAVPTVPA